MIKQEIKCVHAMKPLDNRWLKLGPMSFVGETLLGRKFLAIDTYEY